jgi:hypothetical protein
MKLVRTDSEDFAPGIDSARAWASWNSHTLALACAANVLALLASLTSSLFESVRAAVWLGVPAFLVLNGFVFWRARAARRGWVIAVCPDRLYLRLIAQRSEADYDRSDPDVLVLEAAEIASMSIQTVEVFLYEPKPRYVQSLIIGPAREAEKNGFSHIRQLLRLTSPNKAVLVTDENGRFAVDWRWLRPSLPAFLQQITQECPAVTIGREGRSELDLNAIWDGIWRKPDARERQILVRAKRLGFGCKCAALLSRHRHMPYKKAAAYLAEIERTGPETEPGEWPALTI